ncbi:FxsB family cyclophane-forming radical SAM/SPASM peptide maturase [Streptomyces sp. NPDC002867]
MLPFIDQFVLKVHGACDLACDHCYVYEHPDQSWREKPRTMSPAVAEQVAKRIAEHVENHAIPMVRITLHGGEPLLLGISRMRELIRTIRAVLDNVVRLSLHVQTNGVTLNERFCELFDALGVQLGVSLDGDRASNDRHRRYANGRSSHAGALRGLALLRRPDFRHLYGGILCTVDVANDPIAVYEALLKEAPPRLDFLLPHATWANPPARHGEAPAPYAAWLGRIHSRWIADRRPVPIRLFDALVAASWNEASGSEAVGFRPVTLAVVDTDGSWEQADSLKTAYDGAPATGMSIFTHSVDRLMAHPGVAARNQGYADLCATCLACPVVRICGGGLYAHRYRPGNGFDNPSVYCADLMVLASEIPAARTRGIAAPRDGDPPRPVIHHLPDGAFDAFAAGAGTVEGTKALEDVQLSLTRALIAGLDPQDGTSDLAVAAALGRELLIELDSSHPVETAEVLRHPFVRTWATHCLRPDGAENSERDRAHVAGIAAAVARRAGITTRLSLPVRAGLAHFPGLGAMQVERAGHTAVVTIERTGRPPRGWIGVRRLSTPWLPVAVEDLDPYRARHDSAALDRLSQRQWTGWQVALSRAGRELSLLVPQYAAPLLAGLRAVVPLGVMPQNPDSLAPVRGRSFGAVALAMPARTTDAAAAMLQEFQRGKLAALMDAYAFFDSAQSVSLSVPWWTGPLPVKQALYGLYAQVALAELWRARSTRQPRRGAPGAPERVRQAVSAFHRHLTWADVTVDALATEAAWAPAGARFAAGLRATIDRLAAEPTPSTAVPRRTSAPRRNGTRA